MRNLRTLPTALLRSPRSAAARRGGALAAAGLCAAGVASLGAPTDARAQTIGDIKLRAPNMMLLVDTSGSMNADPTGGWSGCGSDKSRWVILIETLTGTVNNLSCDTSGGAYRRIRSNDCAPRFNDRNSIIDALDPGDGDGNKYAWPVSNGNGKNKIPIGFRKGNGSPPSSAWCFYNGSGDWDQQGDGILDTFGDKIRFGLMTFDSFDEVGGYPYTEFLPLGLLGVDPWRLNWNAFTDPYRSDEAQPWPLSGSSSDIGSRQASYWFESSGNNWLSGAPTGYGGSVYFPTGAAATLLGLGFPSFGVCNAFPAANPRGYQCPQANFDLGAANPTAGPTYGRMMGFGDPNASIADTVSHNDMVQLGIIGVTPNITHSTPLAALMRDAYEVLLVDDQTDAVTIPHAESDPPVLAKVGPIADPYVFGAGPNAGCRQQHVLAITDGEPFGDLVGTTMGEWAENLYTDSPATNRVNTYIVGVGLSSANWTPAAPADITTTANKLCPDLVAADLNAGGMCERSSLNPFEWRYADECTPGGAVYNGEGPMCDGVGQSLSNADRSSIRACCNILDVAIKGRQPGDPNAKPYFPQTQAELKSMMSDLIANIAGGTLSRTMPAFTTASASSVTAGAAANSYELRSALSLPPGNGLWIGDLERVRWTCGGGTQPFSVSSGDDFAANLAVGSPGARRFFTVSVDATEALPNGSIRPRRTSQSSPDPNGSDCLYGCSVSNVGDTFRLGGAGGPGKDVLYPIESLKSQIDATGGVDAYQMLDLQNSDRTGCQTATNNGNSLGGGWRDPCSSSILEWYGGDNDPTNAAPTRHPNPLGGIYKSVPIVVEPPKAIEEDELFSNERTSPGPTTNSFVKKYGERPTMVYAQSVDGQLHAFVLAANASSGVVGKWDAPTDIPAVNSNTNNELWTFIPPAVMPALFRNFNVHARLGDGPIAVADVALSIDTSNTSQFLPWRTMTDVQNAAGEFRTIIVVSGGPSVLGGFYYALDVTDPLEPRFLWQLSSAGNLANERRDLFGDSVPGAAITTLRLVEPLRGERMVPVAILAGGGMTSLPTGFRNRRVDPASYWPGTSEHRPRSVIRDWGESVPGRSLTVVELYSGRIIARLGGAHPTVAGAGCAAGIVPSSDHPLTTGGASILNSAVVLPNAGDPGFFDSPLTSTPVVYPSGAGKVAQRAYVGDQDGTVWRVNLSDPNPRNWTAQIAFDAYNNESTENTMDDARVEVGAGAAGKLGPQLTLRGISGPNTFALKGQPITTRPLISVDENDQTTVSFATGDPETFQLESVDAINVLVSFVDYFDSSTLEFAPYVNRTAPSDPSGPFQGIEMAFLDGTAVTGPLNLFDGSLIFAYFVPRTGTACTFGRGGWCAVNYLDHAVADVPDPVIDVDGSPGIERCANFTGNEVVFGIQVNQQAGGCSNPAVAASGGRALVVWEQNGQILGRVWDPTQASPMPDPWLAGNYSSITTSSPGGYEIVMHTGQGGTAEDINIGTKSMRKALQTPRSSTFVRSWVNAIE